MKTLLLILAIPVLFSCNNKKNGTEKDISKDSTTLPNPGVSNDFTEEVLKPDQLVLGKTRVILKAIKLKDFNAFSDFIHPTLGIRFSPYAYIDTTKDLTLTADAFRDHVKKQDKLHWGSYDANDEPINESIQNYFKKFVYNADFLNAEKTRFNEFIGAGNSLNNLQEVYKDCVFTESHFSGFDKKFEGMDWTSLRLVFKKMNDQYYLVGVVHDQWTI